MRERITDFAFWGEAVDDPTGRMEHAFKLLVKAEPIYDKFTRAVAKGQLQGLEFEARLADAQAKALPSAEEAALLRDYEAARYDAILTDVLPPEAFPANRPVAQVA